MAVGGDGCPCVQTFKSIRSVTGQTTDVKMSTKIIEIITINTVNESKQRECQQ